MEINWIKSRRSSACARKKKNSKRGPWRSCIGPGWSQSASFKHHIRLVRCSKGWTRSWHSMRSGRLPTISTWHSSSLAWKWIIARTCVSMESTRHHYIWIAAKLVSRHKAHQGLLMEKMLHSLLRLKHDNYDLNNPPVAAWLANTIIFVYHFYW